MPLQLLRGTEAERQAATQPLQEGEPLFITDTNLLYIGKRDEFGSLILPKDLLPADGSGAITEFADDEFVLFNGADASKILYFNLGNISTGTSQTLTVSDQSGTIALAENVLSSVIEDTTPQLGGSLDTNGNKIQNTAGVLALGPNDPTARAVGLSFRDTNLAQVSGNRTYPVEVTTTTLASEDVTSTTRWRGNVQNHTLNLNGFNQTSTGVDHCAGMTLYAGVSNSGTPGSTVATVTSLHAGVDIYNDVAITEAIGVDVGVYSPDTGTIDTFKAVNVVSPTATTKYSVYCADPDTELYNAGPITAGHMTFVLDIPASSVGVDGDVEGMITSDNDYMYRCVADYDGSSDIWVRIAWVASSW